MSSIFGVSSFGAMSVFQRPDAGQRPSSLTTNIAATNVIGATSEKSDAPSAMDLLIDQLLQKGLMRWGQEQRLDALKEKLRAEALQGLGLTEEDLAKMSIDQRAEIEKRIDEAIRQRLEVALAEGQKNQNAESLVSGQPAPKAKPSLIITV